MYGKIMIIEPTVIHIQDVMVLRQRLFQVVQEDVVHILPEVAIYGFDNIGSLLNRVFKSLSSETENFIVLRYR